MEAASYAQPAPAFFPSAEPVAAWRSGRRWVVFGLVVLFLVMARNVLFVWGLPVPLRLVSQLGGVTGFAALVWGMRQLNRHSVMLVNPGFRGIVRLWQVLLVVLFVYGVWRGNVITTAGKEFIAFWLFAAAWLTGANDRLWYAIDKPLTILFYISVPLVLIYMDTVAPVTTFEGTREAEYQFIGVRSTNTIAADFRPVIGVGLFLGMWGLVGNRDKKWRLLQIGAFFVFFLIQAGVFKFRSSAGFAALAGSSILLLRPILEHRRRPGLTAVFIALAVLAVGWVIATGAGEVLWERLTGRNQDPIFASRIAELHAYVSNMGAELLVGRGLGGGFTPTHLIGIVPGASWQQLRAVHFGILVFSLKGGVIMLTLFVLMLSRGFILRPKAWYQDPCNLTAALLFPVLIAQFCLVPFGLTPVGILTYLPTMMMLGRFGQPRAMSPLSGT